MISDPGSAKCVCGHARRSHVHRPFEGDTTACRHGQCSCEEFRPAYPQPAAPVERQAKTTVHRMHKDTVLGPNDVYVGRPSKWGNPWKVSAETDREIFVAVYKDWVYGRIDRPVTGLTRTLYKRVPFTIEDIKRELKGRRLFCWCPPGVACHAKVLAEIADS